MERDAQQEQQGDGGWGGRSPHALVVWNLGRDIKAVLVHRQSVAVQLTNHAPGDPAHAQLSATLAQLERQLVDLLQRLERVVPPEPREQPEQPER